MVPPRAFLSALRRDTGGAAAILFAGSLFALIGTSALAVDLGSVYLAKRRLQGMADAAALSAAGSPIANGARPAAEAMLGRSPSVGARLASLSPGTYTQDQRLAPEARFTPGGASPSAVRVRLEQDVPLVFGKLVTGGATMRIAAVATAARMDMAAFSIGSRLAHVGGGLPSQLLSALAGSDLELSVLDGQSLLDLKIDLLRYADALGARIGRTGATQADIFAQRVTMREAVDALADVAGTASGAAVLRGIAAKLGAGSLTLDQLIDLGPAGRSGSADGHNPITVDALSMVRAVLGANGGKAVLDLKATVPGIAATRATLLLDGARRESPWLTVTNSRDVVIRAAQARLYVEATLGSPVPGIATLRLPLYVELAPAEARLADIRCSGDSAGDGVDLNVTPSIGSVAIAEISPAALDDFAVPAAIRPAALAQTPILRVNAQAQVSLGGVSPQRVHFSRAEIAARIMRTVSTNDAIAAIAASLAQRTTVSVTTLGLTVSVGPVASAVGGALSLAAPALDGLINQITALLGVQLGSADVRVERMRCGTPVLVA